MGSIISTPINAENLELSLQPIYDDIATKAHKIKVFNEVFVSNNGIVELTDAILPIQDTAVDNAEKIQTLDTAIVDINKTINEIKKSADQIPLLKQDLITLDNSTLGHTVWRYLSYDALIAQESMGYFAGYIFDKNMSMGIRKEFLRADYEQLLNSGALIVENGSNADTFYLPLKENEFIRHVGSLAQYGTHQEDATQKWWAAFGNQLYRSDETEMKKNVNGAAKALQDASTPGKDPNGKTYAPLRALIEGWTDYPDSSGIIIDPSTKVRMNDNETTVKNMAWILLYKLKPTLSLGI